MELIRQYVTVVGLRSIRGCTGTIRINGEALDFYNSDISVEGPHPFNPSGGNNGCGRTHGNAHFTDSIQQVQGRAGGRQVKNVNISVANCTRQLGCAGLMFGKNPD